MTVIQLSGFSVQIDTENEKKLAEIIIKKLQEKIPLDELERAFRQAQIDEDKKENEETFRRY